MWIEVKLLTGKTAGFTVDSNCTISRLLDILERNGGLPASFYRIIFAGKAIDEEDSQKTLAECYILEGSVLHCVQRLRDGPKWGRWTNDAKVHRKFPASIQKAIFCWACMAHLKRLPRDIGPYLAIEVCKWIATRSGWI